MSRRLARVGEFSGEMHRGWPPARAADQPSYCSFEMSIAFAGAFSDTGWLK
jgi:hypothetical protein